MKSSKLSIIAALLTAAASAPAQNFELRTVTIANGGGTSAGGSYAFTHTIGLPVLGTMSGGSFTMSHGFQEHQRSITSIPPAIVVGNLPHTALGLATIRGASNSVQISNLGSNGEDGVSIALGQATGWSGTLVHQLSSSNRGVGDRIEWIPYGEKNGQANEILMNGRVERTADCLALYADASSIGASGFLLEAFSNGVAIAQISVSNGLVAWLRPPPNAPPPPSAALALDWEDMVGRGYVWTRWWFYDRDWDELEDPDDFDDLIDLAEGENPPTVACQLVTRDPAGTAYVINNADAMRISPIHPTATVQTLSRVEFRGVNSGSFWLGDEAIEHQGARLHTRGGTTFLTESNRVRFLPDSKGVIQARALAPLSTDMTRNCLAFHTPGLALAASGSGVTFTSGNATGTLGALTLSRSSDGILAVNSSFPVTGGSNRVVVELFNSTSRVGRLSLPAGALGTLSGTGRIVTAGAAQGRVPTLSVVFDAPMTFSSASLAPPGGATGFRVFPDHDLDRQVWAVADRFDVATVNEQFMEWIDRIIIRCPGPTRPLPPELPIGARPRFTFATETGVDYLVQSWDSLDGTLPTTVQRVTGTGGLLTFEEPRTDHVTVRFYRIVPAQESLWEGLRGAW